MSENHGTFQRSGWVQEAGTAAEAVKLEYDGWTRLPDEEVEQLDLTPTPPPMSGKGSGDQAWRDYAAAVGVQVDPDAGRSDVVDALQAAGKPVGELQ